jgi:hypothetical protein
MNEKIYDAYKKWKRNLFNKNKNTHIEKNMISILLSLIINEGEI